MNFQDLIFSNNSFGELCAQVQMTNISSEIVGFKMKTTTPDRYKVRPSSGALKPGETVVMEVRVKKNQNTLIVQDKFMIIAVSIPSSSSQSLHDTLKTSRPDAQYKLRCSIQHDQQVNIDLRLELDSTMSQS